MLEKVLILIDKENFSLEGFLSNGEVICQEWQTIENANPIKMSGPDCCTFEFPDKFLNAFEQVQTANSKLSGCLTRGEFDPIDNFSIGVGAGWVDAYISENENETVLRYEWDENAQLKPLQVISGEIESVPHFFLDAFHDAAFGRYGLLARVILNAKKVVEPIDDMGALRWA